MSSSTTPASDGSATLNGTPDLGPTEWTWASARLRLGQSNVGFWVVVSALIVLVQPALGGGDYVAHGARWTGIVAAYLALQVGFDIVGGYVLPERFGRSNQTPWAFAMRLGRATLLHAAVLLAVGWVALLIGRAAGDWAALGALALVSGVLIAFQGALATAVSGDTVPPTADERAVLEAAGIQPDRVDVSTSDEPVFVGGWVGSRGLERLVVPRTWLAALDEDERHALLVRRRIALESGARARGVIAALAYNTFGAVCVLALVPGASYTTASGLLVATAGFTLWAFLGVLTLPTLSRRAVFDLDRRAAAELEHPGILSSLISRLDRQQDDEPDRPPLTEAIFHPVPTPRNRVDALAKPAGRLDPLSTWRVARTSLFAGWAHASWLSRAVHCNIGRPDVWVVYPGD
jgi:hypothetical protein